MTVGFPLSKDQLDTRLGQIALQVPDGLDEAAQVKVLLDTLTTADLVALGYDEATRAEVSTMKSAYTDLYNLQRVATGQATQGTANDFLFWARKLLGVFG